MTITAKYPGRCRVCGGAIRVGETIEWKKGSVAAHLKCPRSPSSPPSSDTPAAPADPAAVKISRGQGYGGQPYTVGQVLFLKWTGVYRVIKCGQRYVREDGLSFGVGDDQGYIYSASCVPATAAETAEWQARHDAAEERKQAATDLAAWKRRTTEIGEKPEREVGFPEGERLQDTRTIYGGGDCIVIAEDKIWYIRNNGADGDDWSRNNVRTGGAGAIGRYIPRTVEVEAALRGWISRMG